MKYAFIADIHGNYEALKAVMGALRYDSPDIKVCLGDVVGYGPEPVECISTVIEEGFFCLAGNHDHGVAGRVDESVFNYFAREALLWTRAQLSNEQITYLANLGYVAHFPGLSAAHGSLHGPELFNYIQTLFDAELSFEALDKKIFFYGHTHVPMVFFNTTPMTYTMSGDIEVSKNHRCLVNIGSVGQPRDEDPRACYCIYDTEEERVFFRRVPYNVQATARKIIDAGLPEALAIRIELGK
ncbi:MAG: metallophosphoesterase family protein [Planctomycetes bacterium]|nr:metallophosphoesterase family protein [Planctomycetota bacterium]